MKRSLLLSIALGMAICTSNAFARVSTNFVPGSTKGYFHCSVAAPNHATAILKTENVNIKGTGCDSHALHTTADELNRYAYAFERTNPLKGANVHVKVKGLKAKHLICQEGLGGRVEAPGEYCAQPSK